MSVPSTLSPNQVEVITRFMPLAQALLDILGERPHIIKGKIVTHISFNNEADADAFLDLFLDMDEGYRAA